LLRTLFILSIFVPGFVAALFSPVAALGMYLWFALFRPQEWLWIDVTSLRLSLVLAGLLVVRSISSGLWPNVTHPLSVGMILFLVAALVSQFGAVSPDVGWTWIDFLSRLFLTGMLLIAVTSSPRSFVAVVGVIAISLGFHAAKAGLAFVLGGGTRFSDGLAGAFVDNNGYAAGTVMIMPLLVATAQNVQFVYTGRFLPWIRRGVYASVPLCTFAVIGTYSRGGFVALAAVALMFLLLQRRRFIALASLAAVVTVLLLLVPIPQSYMDRLQTIRTYKETGEESALSRPHFWQVGLRMLESHPFGVGLRQYEAAYDQYDFSYGRYGHRRAVHNSHVQVLAELGYFGAAVWSGLLLYSYFACMRVRARSRAPGISPEMGQFLFTSANGLLTSMTGFVIAGSFLSLALNDVTWLTFAMVAALDRISSTACAAPATAPAPVYADVPLAFRAVDSFATLEGRRA
jgi:putative inorganic carbon (HCO3(-)) transporter